MRVEEGNHYADDVTNIIMFDGESGKLTISGAGSDSGVGEPLF